MGLEIGRIPANFIRVGSEYNQFYNNNFLKIYDNCQWISPTPISIGEISYKRRNEI